MQLNLSTKDFTYMKEHNQLVADASDLGLAPGQWPEEIRITSEKTGRTVLFHRGSYEATIDDILWVDYKAAPQRPWQGHDVTTVVRIFND